MTTAHDIAAAGALSRLKEARATRLAVADAEWIRLRRWEGFDPEELVIMRAALRPRPNRMRRGFMSQLAIFREIELEIERRLQNERRANA